jgi:hypothetical protein
VPRRDIELRGVLGVDKMMWGSDYPHPEGTWPNTQQYYLETFAGIPEADGRKILGENAIAWYGLQAVAVQAVADKIGPSSAIFHATGEAA